MAMAIDDFHSCTILLLLLFHLGGTNALSTLHTNNTVSALVTLSCATFDDIEHGVISLEQADDYSNLQQVLHVRCNPGYDLFGPPKILCINDSWKIDQYPKCIARCHPPPKLSNGDVDIDMNLGTDKKYSKGTVATYSCHYGYLLQPSDGQYRVCEKGIWTGTNVSCVLSEKSSECKPLRDIDNGYLLHERVMTQLDPDDTFIVHYYCKSGYKLKGAAVLKCLPDGTWFPKVLPQCILTDEPNCPLPESYPHATSKIIAGNRLDDMVISGTEVEFNCLPKYRNANNPCEPSRMRCMEGKWMGMPPSCEIANECDCPPKVSWATSLIVTTTETGNKCHYPINTKVTYECMPEYELKGNIFLNCSSNGCWTPVEPPVCKIKQRYYYLETNGGEPIIFSLATGAVVLLILVIACLVIVCRKRKPFSRTVAIPPPVPRSDLADHASLLHPPDRLALIAFADGMQVGQSGLPTYEEATRDRSGGIGAQAARLQRPPWPSLAGRRSRNSPNPDNMLFTRQGSFASHTASSRSGGDPMGSTDTMAVSENSTTVTLDTASSHSGSQPASCRAHCGSLASFDTSSVLNTEGVPLLEESELEEIQCGETVSLAMENRSMCDSSSYKLSTASDIA
ncbi:sushi domain-containing protein 4-like [Atheta coriaria]|uniref:sushi domain-containing protein 4-like n=1 Tax=Dalotia coriaria TaxID=877792 RepID=UPI0031F42331